MDYDDAARSDFFWTSRGSLARQTRLDLHEAEAGISRDLTPVSHYWRWRPIVLKASQRNQTIFNLPKYDTGYIYDGSILYDTPVPTIEFVYPAPSAWTSVAYLSSSIEKPAKTWISGTEFIFVDGVLRFRADPLTDPKLAPVTVVEADGSTDQEITLWAAEVTEDHLWLARKWAVPIGMPKTTASSELLRSLLTAAYDSRLTGETSLLAIRRFLAAILGRPIAEDYETVRLLGNNPDGSLWIATDCRIYNIPNGLSPAFAAGDSLEPGDFLDTGVQFTDLRYQPLPVGAGDLGFGAGFLGPEFKAPLVFPNRQVPLTSFLGTDGLRRVRFEIDGSAADVSTFWADVDARGAAAGKTLAQCLDQRENPTGDPSAGALPATVNPAALFTRDVLSGNAFLVYIIEPNTPDQGLGLDNLRFLLDVFSASTGLILRIDIQAPILITTFDETTDSGLGEYDEMQTASDASGEAFLTEADVGPALCG